MRKYRETFGNVALITLSVTLMLAGCSMLRPNLNASPPPPSITYSAIENGCPTPDEAHPVAPTSLNPAPYMVVYYEQCLSRKDVVVVVWPGEASNLNVQFGHLLGIHYQDTLSFRRSVGHTYERFGPFSNDDGTSWILVYHITPE
jgi:hypothetical protein